MINKKETEAANKLIDIALSEDVGSGDLTTDNLIPLGMRKKAYMIAKSDGIIAGLEVAEMVFKKLDNTLLWNPEVQDGTFVKKGTIIVRFEAGYRAILTGERTALNFLQRMCGIATQSANCVKAVADYKCTILDTRKTLPGFRLLDKYSVKTGGAQNHRIGLFDMVMIKDNHIEVAGGIIPAVEQIRKKISTGIKIEVETTNLKQVKEALSVNADIIMLDNMDNKTMAEAVILINGKAKTEASGNMTKERLREVAATGVDFISMGNLTHSIKAMDISQRID